MERVNPATNVASIRKHFAASSDREKVRTSVQRREHLEKLASLHSGKNVYVQISGEEAYADIAKRDSRTGYTDRLVINIPADVPSQSVTNYDGEAWDLLFQKVELYHELGHVMYTDWPSFENVVFGDGQQFGVEQDLRRAFRDWWNALEDAAIERLLADRFNIEDDLRVKNENLLRQHSPANDGKYKSLHEAISIALMEYKHPIGWIDTLLDDTTDELEFLSGEDRELFVDEIQPIIEDMAPDIVTEGDPVERNHMVYAMYERIKPHLDTGDAPGTDEQQAFGFPDDGEDRGDESEGSEVAIPDDEEPVEPEQAMKYDFEREYDDELKREKDAIEQEQDRADDIEEWVRVIDKEYDEGTSMSLDVLDDPPENGTFDPDTQAEAKRLSHSLSAELEARLQQERKSQKATGQRSGKVDTKRVHKTQQGKTNVFKKTDEPDEKDYACFIIVDRSGSMDSYDFDMVPDVEQAAGALAYALEDVGVDVGQISLSEGWPRLEKSIGEDVDEAKQRMFRGHNGGGTPLSDALAVAKARLNDLGSHPFVIVLTDGEPDHRERYRDILHDCNFPVLGVYVARSDHFDNLQKDEASYFHALEYRQHEEALDGVQNMVKQVMF